MDHEARRFALTITRKADYSLHFDPDPNSIGFANALSYHFTGNESLEEKKQLAIAHAVAVEEGRAVQKPYFFFTSELNPLNPLNPGFPGFQGVHGFQGQDQQPETDLYSPNHLTPPSHGKSPHRVRSLHERSRTQISPHGHSRRPNSMSGPGLNAAGPPGTGVWKPEGSSVIKKGRKGKLTDAQREGAKVNRLKKSVCEKHRKARTKCDPEKCPDNALYGVMKSRRASGASSSMWNSPPSENKRSPSSVSSGYFPNVSNPGSIGALDSNSMPNNPNLFQQPYSNAPPPNDPFPRTPDNQYVQPLMPPLGQHPYELTGITTPDQPVTRPGQPPDVLSEYTVNDDWINFDVDMSKNDPYPIYSSGPLIPNLGTEIHPQGLASSYFSGNESLQSRPVSIRPVSLADFDPTFINDGTQTGSWPTYRSPKGGSKPELRAKKWLDKLKKYISKFRRTFKV